jgi:hypothetical protein
LLFTHHSLVSYAIGTVHSKLNPPPPIGHLRVKVLQARQLAAPRSLASSHVHRESPNTYVEMELDGTIHSTHIEPRNSNPNWTVQRPVTTLKAISSSSHATGLTQPTPLVPASSARSLLASSSTSGNTNTNLRPPSPPRSRMFAYFPFFLLSND